MLLDLPDFDSVEESHRVEVDRVVGLADLMVWVLDPQKYADGVLHERYLRPYAAYGDAMVAVLNQTDRLVPEARAACVADLEGLLAADGLAGVPVLAVSAATGDGLDALRDELERRVAAREAAVARLAADVDAVAAPLATACGTGRAGKIGRDERGALATALSDAAGVPSIVRAVAGSHRRAGGLATGWPYVRWLRRARPDPLRRLRLPGATTPRGAPGGHPLLPAGGDAGAARAGRGGGARARHARGRRTSRIPGRGSCAAPRSRTRTRSPTRWRRRSRARTCARAGRAGGGSRACCSWRSPRRPSRACCGCWRWPASASPQLEDAVPTPEYEGFPIPTLLAGGGALAGLLVGFLAGILVRAGARRRSRAAARALRAPVERVAEEHILAPVASELDAHARLCEAVGRRRRGVPSVFVAS